MIYIKKLVHIFLGIFIAFFLLPLNLLIIFRNRKLISKYDHIVIQTVGGYGHTFTALDLSKMLFANKFLYIRFFEASRHNLFMPELFGINYLTIKTSILIKYFNKETEIGEIENTRNNFRIVRKILISFIRLFSRRNILIDNDIYRYSEKKYPNQINKLINDKEHYWVSTYYYLHQTKNKIALNLMFFEKFLRINNLKKIIQLRKNKKNNVAIYLRNRKSNLSNSDVRNGSGKNDYMPLLRYLIKKKKNIFLTGDKIFDRNDLEKIGGNIIDPNIFRGNLKSILRIYLNSISDYYISENGGGQYFGLHAKKWLSINTFPPVLLDNRSGKKTKILHKKILDKKKKKYFFPSIKYINFFYRKKIYNKKNIIKSNSSEEILKFIKEIII